MHFQINIFQKTIKYFDIDERYNTIQVHFFFVKFENNA